MRLFVALELPAPVVSALAAWGASAARNGLRVLPAASLHVTLAFLGARPDDEAGAIGEAVVACAAPVPGLSVAGADWLGRGSALALDLADGDGACSALKATVARALVELGVLEPETRPFRPHVTVARVRRGARVSRAVPDPPRLGTFPGTALTLFESVPGGGGARYRPLGRVELAS